MTTSSRQPVRLAFQLCLRPPMEEGWAAGEALEAYARELMEDLGIPASVDLEVVWRSGDIPARWPYLLTVGGERVRPDLLARSKTLAERARHDLYRNRELLISREVAQTLASAWSPGRLKPKLEAKGLMRVLREFAARNLRLARLQSQYPQRPDLGHATPEKWIFQAFRDDSLRLEVRVSPRQWKWLVSGAREAGEKVQAALLRELGCLCPLMKLDPDERLAGREYQVALNDVRLPRHMAPTLDLLEHLPKVLGSVLRDNATALITGDTVARGLALLRQTSPLTVSEVVSRYGEALIGRVLASLVEEGVSIRNFQGILTALALVDKEALPADLSRYMVLAPHVSASVWVTRRRASHPSADDFLGVGRASLHRYLSDRCSQDPERRTIDGPRRDEILRERLVPMDSALERRVAEAEERPLTERERERLVESILCVVEERGVKPTILLTTRQARRRLWELIRRELPSIWVLSYEELPPELAVQLMDRGEAQRLDAEPAPLHS